jgi:uncharacterized protein (DUF2235 family)
MHLLVFCDGTWNTPDQLEGGLPAPTNVVKLRNALAAEDGAGKEQRSYYHPGVGTDPGILKRVTGGGLGEGLDRNIKSSYNWLARNYQPGAKIWLFGFSRGAYTARSLGGMISRCGLLDPTALSEQESWAAVDDLFEAYRKKETIDATPQRPFHLTGTSGSPKHSIEIHFIGVWDTVGSLGVPDDLALANLIDDPTDHSFHDTDLSPIVKHARHAVAMDEHRQSFIPTLWTQIPDGADVKQVWFPGCHGDVGGGYGRCGLSDLALGWMMKEAEAEGLAFNPKIRNQLCGNHQAQLHDSVTGIFKQLKTRPRAVPIISIDSVNSGIVHRSALKRQTDPPITQGTYWRTLIMPANGAVTVPVFARDRWNYTGIFLEAGTTYAFEAEGEWKDDQITCGPGGPLSKESRKAFLARMATAALGNMQEIYSKVTGNYNVDFLFSLREDDMPWFSLVGLVANAIVPTQDPKEKYNYLPHETFLIGKQATFTPKASGYLYAFANDTWQTYDNNHGQLRLTVKVAASTHDKQKQGQAQMQTEGAK